MIIAIDGVSASGKGTLAKLLAKKYNYAYLDTGLLYRAVAYKAYENNCLDNITSLETIAINLKAEDLENPALQQDWVAKLASNIAVHNEVRSSLLDLQRNFGKNYGFTIPNQFKGAILDGRDIGTVIFPQASLKFFITASSAVRAQRRLKQLQAVNSNLTIEEIKKSLEDRDTKDSQRKLGALKKAADAYEIDTTLTTIEENLQEMSAIIDRKLA